MSNPLTKTSRLEHLSFTLALALGLIGAWWRTLTIPYPMFDSSEYQINIPSVNMVPTPNPSPVFIRELLPKNAITPTVHSPTLVRLPNGNVLAAWFGGSREGAKDVAIYASERNSNGWSSMKVLANRKTVEQALQRPIRKLGNPVLTIDKASRVWLFFVVVSLGGWSTSAVAYQISTDNGQHFSLPRLLVTSPVLNISTLVRARPLNYQDGSIAVPMYHELLGKFGLNVRIASGGRILSIAHIGNLRTAIQPTIVAINSQQAIALLRRTGIAPPQVLWSRTNDGGQSWSLPQASNLSNPDSSCAAIRRFGGGILLAYNPTKQGRNILSLARFDHKQRWQHLHDLERGQAQDEFSYPFLISGPAYDYTIVYTWKRRRIAYIHFNEAWLQTLP